MPGRDAKFTLKVPLDASQVGKEAEAQKLQVVARARDGSLTSKTVQAEGGSRASVTLSFREAPGPLQLLVGPASAAESDLVHAQTISVDVRSQQWSKTSEITIEPIVISSYYWYWWLVWCREYVIRGRLLCADGSPVPGARVCAYDVDWWFWWTSTELVGCATTGANGEFEIAFRRCCGLWPWWWWENRVWQIDPDLVARVSAVLERDPRLALGRAKNQPSLAVFSEILAPLGVQTGGTLQASDVGRLEQIRETVLAKLPASSELEALDVWPWAPWRPWWDCEPNINFSATQNCKGEALVLDEGFAQTRWNISDPLEVVLTANDQACCVQPACIEGPCLEDCVVVAEICQIVVDEIGGNAGTPATPLIGLAYPDAVTPGSCAWAGDRPFAGTVRVECANQIVGFDYFEFEYYSTTGSPATWSPLPVAATPTIVREYWDTLTGKFPEVAFPFESISGHYVVESQEHYEQNPANGWDGAHDYWIGEPLLVVIDSTKFPGGDGTYWFRVVGWKIENGELVKRQVLTLCGTETDNGWVLTFNNPNVLVSPYPDAEILEVLVDGEVVKPCDVVPESGGQLEVVFKAYDPEGWLGGYTLEATYGSDGSVDLLAQASSQLAAIPADCVGPEYGRALLEPASPGVPCVPLIATGTVCATAPTWHGGTMRLTIDLAEAFPEPCCYQLNLHVWTRHILDCDQEPAPYENWQWYTIGYGVCPPPLRPVQAAEPERPVDAAR
jgi:hypothetical protein